MLYKEKDVGVLRTSPDTKRVLLINPPTPFLAIQNAAPHLGMGYLIAYLRGNGVETDYANYETSDPANIVVPEGYDFYGFTAVSPQYQFAKRLHEQVKRWHLGQTVIGGGHASSSPESCLKDGFDYVVKGYGEEALLSIVNGQRKKGVIQGAQIRNLDSLPYPSWDDLYGSEYNYSYGEKTGHVFSMRGCPFGCNYCASPDIYGNVVGWRSVEAVAEEVEMLRDRFGKTNIYFFDPTFTLDRTRAINLAERLGDLDISWACQTRVDRIDPKLMVALRKGGCDRVSFGVEAGSIDVHQNLGKGTTVNQNELAIRMAHDAGIKVKAYLMGALPDDNWESADRFKEFIFKNKPDAWLFSTFIPMLGTDYWRNPEKYGIKILCKDVRAYYPVGLNARGPINVSNRYLSREDLRTQRDDLLEFLRQEIPDQRVEKAIKDFPEQRKIMEPYLEGLDLNFMF